MQQPWNAAAEQVVRAQSIIADLTVQLAEVQAAIGRQQSTIDALLTVAVWAPAPEEVPDGDDS